jgi:hypothetical protein
LFFASSGARQFRCVPAVAGFVGSGRGNVGHADDRSCFFALCNAYCVGG